MQLVASIAMQQVGNVHIFFRYRNLAFASSMNIIECLFNYYKEKRCTGLLYACKPRVYRHFTLQ